tara:strand:+ start:4112 stop:6778 length:2667 start_codon:yes stop_codon:yes gene_type:complete
MIRTRKKDPTVKNPHIVSRKKENPHIVSRKKERPPWKSQNIDSFPVALTQKIDYLLKNPDTEETTSFEYQKHQKIVRQYISSQTPYRGILLYHGLGSGKTCSSIAIAEGLKNRRKTVLLSPASLESNYREELLKCGHMYYIKENKWSYTTNETLLQNFSKIPSLSNGAFVIDDDGQEYENMSEVDSKNLKKQINVLIDHYYTFLHYDGLRTNKIDHLKETNYFDGKTIIVDEVHNLISRMSGGGSQGIRWYDIFINVKNARFIFLSGTPVVNYVHEYALLFNILRGPMVTYEYKINGTIDNVENIMKKIRTYPNVDFCKIVASKNLLVITKPPKNYKINEDGILSYEETPQTHELWETNIKEFLKKDCNLKLVIESKKVNTHYCFPTNKADFDAAFIDKSEGKLLNEELFARRITGLVSYYMPPRNENDFPYQHETQIVYTPMSMSQYLYYENIRFEELEKEAQKKTKMGKKKPTQSKKTMLQQNDHEDSTYKIFSRAACNFVFPESIIRPTANTIEKSMEQLKIEAENKLEDYMNETKNMKKIEIDERISLMSPKYFLIQDLVLNAPGTCLIYTVLRHMEGVSALSHVLNTYGWTPITIEKFGGEWRCRGCGPKSYILYTGTEVDPMARFYSKALFNNQWNMLPESIKKDLKDARCSTNLRGESCKVFIITKTGAEGITLKNIRQVHIVESHWNFVRAKQVIGRAVRYESHKDLPKEDRDVRIYQYVTNFGDEINELKKNSRHSVSIKALTTKDKNMTSDEAVYYISKKKENLISQIEKIIERVSIDCSLYNKGNCMKFTQTNEFTFDPDFSYDLSNSKVKKTKTVKKKYSRIVVDPSKNVLFAKFPKYLHNTTLEWDKDSNQLFKEDNPSTCIGIFDGKKFKKYRP